MGLKLAFSSKYSDFLDCLKKIFLLSAQTNISLYQTVNFSNGLVV